MGIDTKIRKWFKDQLCKAAFSSKSPFVGPKGVLVRDEFTIAHRFAGNSFRQNERDPFTFTGDEFYNEYMQPIKAAMQSGCFVAVVMCVDIRENVPPEKAATERARRRVDDIEPIPDAAKMCREGVELDGARIRFDVRAAMRNREWRGALWRYLVRRAVRDAELGRGCALIIDMDARGPIVIRDGRFGIDRRHAHGFGEADLMVIYWLTQYPNSPVLIDSIDSDFMPIVCHYLWTLDRPRGGRVYWRYWRQNHCDLTMLADNIYRRWRCSSLQFMLSCILCGSDYFVKSSVLANIGFQYVFYGVQRLRFTGHLENIFDADEEHAADALEMVLRSIFSEFLAAKADISKDQLWFTLHRHGIPSTAETIQENLNNRDISNVSFPPRDQIKQALQMLLFNAGYWARNWPALPVSPP